MTSDSPLQISDLGKKKKEVAPRSNTQDQLHNAQDADGARRGPHSPLSLRTHAHTLQLVEFLHHGNTQIRQIGDDPAILRTR